MEAFTVFCEKLWIIMIFAAFFVSWAKGWLKKGFYLTSDQAQEAENKKKKQDILNRAKMSCKVHDSSGKREK